MTLARAVIAIALLWAVAGCSTYGDAPVYGAAHSVSSADLQAALAAIRKERPVPEAYAFRVISTDEIWVYFTPEPDGSAYIATRRGGHWKFGGAHLKLKEPLQFDPNPNS